MTPRDSEVVYVLLTFGDDTAGVMEYVTVKYNTNGTVRWTRQASAAAIQLEIDRTRFPSDKKGVRSWRPIDPGDIPADRTFRPAWRDRGTSIAHDMDHVRDIAVSQIRARRNKELAELDAEWMKANGRGDTATAAQVESRRQEQRDRPQRAQAAIATCATVAAVITALTAAGEHA